MALSIEALVLNETARREAFPVCAQKIFLAHAAVTALPKCAVDAMVDYLRVSSEHQQEPAAAWREVQQTREVAAAFIGAEADEIALLGPTALGLSLFANGLPWQQGDEILCYRDDYPANVYPWLEQQRRGVTVRYIQPAAPGEITPDLVAESLSPKTRLVALASCHFFSGYQIDVDAIGKILHERDVFFSLDAIQTLGAFPLSVEHVDFLSADAHKWMLGPLAIGIVYVKKKHFDVLRPTLLGAWNVKSPNFITQDEIIFADTAQRYEPGVLNIVGIYGMRASLEMLLGIGINTIGARLLSIRDRLVEQLAHLGFKIVEPAGGPHCSAITTFSHPKASMRRLFQQLEQNGVVASFRHDRAQREYIRFSPHFYNTESELDRAVAVVEKAL